MPGVAWVWLSETAIVLNASGTPPASVTPCSTAAARSRWLRLHGIVLVHIEAIPTIGPLEPVGLDPHRPEVRARAGALVPVGELPRGPRAVLLSSRRLPCQRTTIKVEIAQCMRRWARPPIVTSYSGSWWSSAAGPSSSAAAP